MKEIEREAGGEVHRRDDVMLTNGSNKKAGLHRVHGEHRFWLDGEVPFLLSSSIHEITA